MVWCKTISALTLALALLACGGSGSSSGSPDGPNTGGDDATGICVEAWTCSGWTTDGASNSATRMCADTNACGTTAQRPTLTATLPPLDPEYYECNVEPIVQADCSMLGCHGTETGRAYRVYARGRLRMTGGTINDPNCTMGVTSYASEVCIGNLECKCWTHGMLGPERRRSFDSARGFALGDDGQPLPDMAQSQLLLQPQVGGGFAHAGIQWWAAGDASYTKIKAWLDGAQLGSVCNSGN